MSLLTKNTQGIFFFSYAVGRSNAAQQYKGLSLQLLNLSKGKSCTFYALKPGMLLSLQKEVMMSFELSIMLSKITHT